MYRELILRSHHQAMSRTGISTEIAITAERHINVKLGYAQLNGSSIRSEYRRFLLGALLSRHVDAVNRTCPNALSTANTVLDFVEEPHAGPLGESPSDIRILQCARLCEEMVEGDLHPN